MDKKAKKGDVGASPKRMGGLAVAVASSRPPAKRVTRGPQLKKLAAPGPLAHRDDLPAHERAISQRAYDSLKAGLDAADDSELRLWEPSAK